MLTRRQLLTGAAASAVAPLLPALPLPAAAGGLVVHLRNIRLTSLRTGEVFDWSPIEGAWITNAVPVTFEKHDAGRFHPEASEC